MKKNKAEIQDRTYYDCVCGCSTIRMILWHDWPEEVDFSILRYANWGKPGWKQRLSHIWEIIKTGTPWADELVLSLEDMERFNKDLGEVIVKSKAVKKP